MINVYISALPRDLQIGEICCVARKNEIENVSNERVKREKYFVWKLLCHALKHSFDIDEQNLNFTKLDCGAWMVEGAEISISHSDDAIAVAVSDAPVGIDVERVHKPRSNRMAEFIMNKRELAIFNSLSDEAKEERLIEIWTAKEAIFKTKKAPAFLPKETDIESYPIKTVSLDINDEKYICTVATLSPSQINLINDVDLT